MANMTDEQDLETRRRLQAAFDATQSLRKWMNEIGDHEAGYVLGAALSRIMATAIKCGCEVQQVDDDWELFWDGGTPS